MPYTYDYPRPSLTVDCLIFGGEANQRQILLIQRKHEPFKDCWAIPGGFMDMNENLEQAALRELEEETGVTQIALTQMHTFSQVDRDPRGRTISVAFYGFANLASTKIKAADDASNVAWFPIRKLPPLAFDHVKIIEFAVKNVPTLSL